MTSNVMSHLVPLNDFAYTKSQPFYNFWPKREIPVYFTKGGPKTTTKVYMKTSKTTEYLLSSSVVTVMLSAIGPSPFPVNDKTLIVYFVNFAKFSRTATRVVFRVTMFV